MTLPIIEFQGLSKTYIEAGRSHLVFNQVDTIIKQGEFTVLVGKSGSGKSTLLNLISGIDCADKGVIKIKDQSLSGMNENQRTLFRRKNIGFVFQNYNLIPTLSIMDNLLLPLELTGQINEASIERAHDLLDKLSVKDRSNYFPDKLSGGEQQRIAIARALIHEPEIILADEPTGNLDEETGQNVLSLLDELVREAGLTMVMVTHSRDVIGLADRVLTIRDCKLVELDSFE
ncbi:MAG: ATP-binding cassette domain-containing protein [Gammaproteobacteria bacterium]|nr:ATP-binding cassette domain-containing protein [Gammaproteobacteria bacterium]